MKISPCTAEITELGASITGRGESESTATETHFVWPMQFVYHQFLATSLIAYIYPIT